VEKLISLPTIWPVAAHTDNIGPGSTFVAIPGTKLNGVDFIGTALQKGATTVVVQNDAALTAELAAMIERHNAHLIRVADCRQALAAMSAAAWGNPADKLKIIGVTGTKGKTTTTYLTTHILKTAGYKTAMISGVNNYINGQKLPSALTTPQPDYLHAFFATCVQEDVEYVVMEASAQAFSLHRLDGISFDGIIFTNLSQEHAEFYNSIEDYFAAKCQMLAHCKPGTAAIVNIDDQWGKQFAALHPSASTVSRVEKAADYYIEHATNDLKGLALTLTTNNFTYTIACAHLFGTFNAYNTADAVALTLQLGISYDIIKQAIATFTGVPGRMEGYALANGAYAIIDYAHTPSSFEQVIPMLKSVTPQLVVVFGAGGDRDKTKRPIMGNIAARYADIVIVTADNPRSEDAAAIAAQIMAGVADNDKVKVICELDRKSAIEKAYRLAQQESIILLLGKGPDEYQIIGKEKFYFSDKQTILGCF